MDKFGTAVHEQKGEKSNQHNQNDCEDYPLTRGMYHSVIIPDGRYSSGAAH